MLASFVSKITGFCSRFAWLVVLVTLLAGLSAGYYAVTHFAMDTNSENLVSPDAGWRMDEKRYDKAFPQQNNLILVVIDGATAERAEEAAASLTAALEKDKAHFTHVRQPDAGPFFAHNGLLLLPQKEVQQTMQQLIAAQPFLGGLAADPSLRGVMATLDTTLLGVEGGQTKLSSLDKPITAFDATLKTVLSGKKAWFGWSRMLGSAPNTGVAPTRRFIEVKPVLDYNDLMPGVKATDAIRKAARDLGLTVANGVRVRLTGPVPMADQEFATIAENGLLMAGLMIGAIVLMLWLALHSVRMIVAILVTMILGLAITASIGLLTYGAFNVISVAFIELFVGLGVDFGIQFCVRYRHERTLHGELHKSLTEAGRGIGAGLTLAALAAAAGFFSFLPTSYAGLAELGLIAGAGMIVTYVLSITALPAFLKLFRPRGEVVEVGFGELAPLDRYLSGRPRRVLTVAVVLGLLGALLIPFLHFDSNPLDLRNPHTESVSTALDLMKNPQTSPNTVNVVTHSRGAAAAMAARLEKLPEVSQALTIDTFLPDHQAEKLATIKDAADLLDTTLDPFMTRPPPSDAEIVTSLKATAGRLRRAAAMSSGKSATDAAALADTLDKLAAAKPAARALATNAFVPGLKTLLKQLRAALHPSPVSYDTLPLELKRDWVSPSGLYRVQVFPSGDANNNAVLNRFDDAVMKVAPHVTGTPIIIKESGDTIVNAFVHAGLYSFGSIFVILLLALRRIGDTFVALAPLVLAGILTMASCVIVGIQINFANIIALPLLFGIGVAFDIYFVMAWRNGHRNLLQSPLTRAVIMSAGTTASAFGTLAISSHPGTASMGVILMIALFWVLVVMLFVLPALLAYGLPREGLSGKPLPRV
jgi:hopanoid biosynthesis associated RND transporter like protein HpnN